MGRVEDQPAREARERRRTRGDRAAPPPPIPTALPIPTATSHTPPNPDPTSHPAAPAPSTPAHPSPPPASSRLDPAEAAARAAPTVPPSRPWVAPSPPPPRAPFDWESRIGVRLFAWLGGAALFVAAALFLNYSIQQNLISPSMRVAIGLLLGAGALVGGDVLRAKADRAGQAIGGAGIATLYASLFAAHSLWHLVSSTVAFSGMILVTLTAGVMAVKREAFMVAVLGLLGGFLTPYLVSTGEDRPLALFGYVALLDAGVVVVASRKKWPVLGLMGVAGSGLVYVGWAFKFMDAAKAPYALFAAAVLCALFALTTPDRSRREGSAGALTRVTGSIAAVLPLVLAIVVAGTDTLPVAPPVLVGYLLVLSGGAWLAGRRVEVGALPSLAAALGALTLAIRVDATLFPSRGTITLALFAALPIAWFGLWLARRRAPEAPALRLAATIALAASPLCVAAHVGAVEGMSGPVVPLAAYAWAHVALLVATGAILESSGLLLGALGVAVGSLAVSAFAFKTGRIGESIFVVVVPMLALWSLPLFGPRFRKGTRAWAVAALSLLAHFPFLYLVAEGTWSDGALGASSMGCGLLALVTLVAARKTSAEPESSIAALVGGTSLLFFTAAFPILLSNEWLTVAWALEAAALAWLRLRVKHRGLVIASGLLGAATLARLLVNPAVLGYHHRSGAPILNWWLYTYGVSGLALLAASWFSKRDREAKKSPLAAFFAFAGGLLLFVLLNIEIADYYSTGSTITFQFSGGGFQQDMTYTLAWGIFSLALFVLGMTTRSKPARIWAIVLVCMTVAKGALHDVWSLGSLYRVGAIVGLAVTLLAVSYLTQRFVLRAEGEPAPRPREPEAK